VGRERERACSAAGSEQVLKPAWGGRGRGHAALPAVKRNTQRALAHVLGEQQVAPCLLHSCMQVGLTSASKHKE